MYKSTPEMRIPPLIRTLKVSGIEGFHCKEKYHKDRLCLDKSSVYNVTLCALIILCRECVCVCVCVCVCIDDRVWDNGVMSVIRNYPHTSRPYNI